jgi:hypothetical protein
VLTIPKKVLTTTLIELSFILFFTQFLFHLSNS